jgi:hypothetical protein
MAEITWHVLDLLLASERPRAVAELVAEIGSPIAVADALDTLGAAGLIKRRGVRVYVAR